MTIWFHIITYRIRKNIGKELNLAIWQTTTKSPIFHLPNIFCTHLIQNLTHDLSVALVQIKQSLVKYLASMSSASNTFEQWTRFHIVTLVMLKYVKQEARPSYKPSNLSQQNIKAAQKSDADTINQ